MDTVPQGGRQRAQAAQQLAETPPEAAEVGISSLVISKLNCEGRWHMRTAIPVHTKAHTSAVPQEESGLQHLFGSS